MKIPPKHCRWFIFVFALGSSYSYATRIPVENAMFGVCAFEF